MHCGKNYKNRYKQKLSFTKKRDNFFLSERSEKNSQHKYACELCNTIRSYYIILYSIACNLSGYDLDK